MVRRSAPEVVDGQEFGVTRRTVGIGPVTIELISSGVDVALLGGYRTDDPVSAAVAKLHVHLTEDFSDGRQAAPNHPQLRSSLVSANVVEVERMDVKGRIDMSDPTCVEAHFQGYASSNSLEAMIRVIAAIVLPARNTLILHSSAVASEGQAHVFAGISGAGKSTISQLLGTYYDVEVLSDELLLLSKREGMWFLEVAPFTGKIALPYGASVPLASVNYLEQAAQHERVLEGQRDSMRELSKHVVTYAQHPTTLGHVLGLIGDLVEAIPCYRLRFAKTPDVGSVLDLTCSATEPLHKVGEGGSHG